MNSLAFLILLFLSAVCYAVSLFGRLSVGSKVVLGLFAWVFMTTMCLIVSREFVSCPPIQYVKKCDNCSELALISKCKTTDGREIRVYNVVYPQEVK